MEFFLPVSGIWLKAATDTLLPLDHFFKKDSFDDVLIMFLDFLKMNALF